MSPWGRFSRLLHASNTHIDDWPHKSRQYNYSVLYRLFHKCGWQVLSGVGSQFRVSLPSSQPRHEEVMVQVAIVTWPTQPCLLLLLLSHHTANRRTSNNVSPPTNRGEAAGASAAAAALAAACSWPDPGQTSQQLVVQADQLMSAAAGRHHRAACSAEVGGPPTAADWSTCPAAACRIQQEQSGAGEREACKVVQ